MFNYSLYKTDFFKIIIVVSLFVKPALGVVRLAVYGFLTSWNGHQDMSTTWHIHAKEAAIQF